MVILLTDISVGARRVGAYRIATQLRNFGVETEVIDFLSSWKYNDIIELIDTSKPDWIGISLSYLDYNVHGAHPEKLTSLDIETEHMLLSYIRQKNIPIVLGGANADNIKNHVSNFYISVGYSDLAVLQIHNHIVNQGHLEYSTINNNIVVFADKSYGDIDLKEIDVNYTESDFVNKKELIPLEISRGCIFKCKFCEFAYLGKAPGTYIRDKESIKQDILNAPGNTFLFVDDTFNDDINKLLLIKEIQQEIDKPFSFWAYGRLDLIARYPETIPLMKEIGWNAVSFGIETLNKKSGSAVGKGANPEKLKQTLKEIKKQHPGIFIQINLIVGLPHSDREEIASSVNWLLDNEVVDYLRVIGLDIKDPTYISHSSEFSKNPNRYGYNIVSTDKLRYKWSNATWTAETAKDFADQLNRYISNNISNIPFNILHHSTNNLSSIPKDYIESKILKFDRK